MLLHVATIMATGKVANNLPYTRIASNLTDISNYPDRDHFELFFTANYTEQSIKFEFLF